MIFLAYLACKTNSDTNEITTMKSVSYLPTLSGDGNLENDLSGEISLIGDWVSWNKYNQSLPNYWTTKHKWKREGEGEISNTTSSSFWRLVVGDDVEGANSTGLDTDWGPASKDANP